MGRCSGAGARATGPDKLCMERGLARYCVARRQLVGGRPKRDARSTFGCVPGSSLFGGSDVPAGGRGACGVSSRTLRPSTGRQPPLPVMVENLVSGGMARLR